MTGFQLTLNHVYILTGIYLLIFGFLTLTDREHAKKLGTASFWILYGITFCAGDFLSKEVAGLMVLAMALIVAFKQMGRGDYKESSLAFKMEFAKTLGNKIFIPALCVGFLTFGIATTTKLGALVGLALASFISLLMVLVITRGSIVQSFHEGRRLIDAISWAAILSQLLAALGALFNKAGVGAIVSSLVSSVVPTDSAFAVVAAYCIGMMIFTVIMGNAFAAFAVITSGIGIPLVIVAHGANPAIVGPIAMLAGYCGTLMTPMAANFNVVPAALLEMKSKYGVIKAQVPVAILVLIVNIILMYTLGF